MQSLSDTIGYIAFIAAILFVIHGGYGGWMLVAVACLLIVAWFVFAYSFGEGGGDDGEG